MQCDCLTEMADKLKAKITADPETFKKFSPRKAEALEVVSASGIALNFEDSAVVLRIPFTLWWAKVTKNTEVNIQASFCPFCGVKCKPDTEEKPSK